INFCTCSVFCHSREGGNLLHEKVDSRLRGNDKIVRFLFKSTITPGDSSASPQNDKDVGSPNFVILNEVKDLTSRYFRPDQR
ncbi:MAG: hypothetical protein ACKVOE_02915, partial [Rickettsiales bacterium]